MYLNWVLIIFCVPIYKMTNHGMFGKWLVLHVHSLSLQLVLGNGIEFVFINSESTTSNDPSSTPVLLHNLSITSLMSHMTIATAHSKDFVTYTWHRQNDIIISIFNISLISNNKFSFIIIHIIFQVHSSIVYLHLLKNPRKSESHFVPYKLETNIISIFDYRNSFLDVKNNI